MNFRVVYVLILALYIIYVLFSSFQLIVNDVSFISWIISTTGGGLLLYAFTKIYHRKNVQPDMRQSTNGDVLFICLCLFLIIIIILKILTRLSGSVYW
ncbi:hypothetical protein [Chengkuizengella sediminis]|uniref:hypothetical protein n=1 Tax=Chengkuizengella sediminis TaxID=1885917 RepID=UPI00138A3695|nr:hypothetical protein [Chengkuizengella sediminis]NDI34179.1 hypothetical protein [Chengkuizengella sediminis]